MLKYITTLKAPKDIFPLVGDNDAFDEPFLLHNIYKNKAKVYLHEIIFKDKSIYVPSLNIET
jgi:hypothetical protein